MPGLIRIAPPEILQPEPMTPPVEMAQRWDSPYDGNKHLPSVAVFLSRFAYFRITAHAESAEVEVGGVLTGQWCEDAATGSQFIVVNHMIPARHTRQGSVYLTFTKDTLIDVHERMESLFPGEKIVGWYHTHPRMGVFLSHYDTFLHNNFFPEPWQVALVVEPFSSIAGFFVRQTDGTLDPTRYFGFYEMDGANGRRSVVQWQNLQKIENEYEGGTPHE
jgi:proteasome lid subunit RPN8/RPN11